MKSWFMTSMGKLPVPARSPDFTYQYTVPVHVDWRASVPLQNWENPADLEQVSKFGFNGD